MRDIVNKKFECITENVHNEFYKKYEKSRDALYNSTNKHFLKFVLIKFEEDLKIMTKAEFKIAMNIQLQGNIYKKY